MSSKFSHQSHFIDQWLDDEEGDLKKRSKSRGQAQPIPWTDANGTVMEVYPNLCRVRRDGDFGEFLCQYRRKKIFLNRTGKRQERSPVTVGDRVRMEAIGDVDGIVEGICERKNVFERLAPGREANWVHAIAVNIDLMVIISSIKEPEFSFQVIKKMIRAAKLRNIPVLLCMNKMDLRDDQSEPWSTLLDGDIELQFLSAKQNLGLEILKSRLVGKKVAFCGQSGVGKTTLLQKLLGREIGKVGSISKYRQEGKHTTTSSVMYFYDESSAWIDTPGIREFRPVEGLV